MTDAHACTKQDPKKMPRQLWSIVFGIGSPVDAHAVLILSKIAAIASPKFLV
jgi:hypothetical protein